MTDETKTTDKTVKNQRKKRGTIANLKPFPKGVSGNPKGRPIGSFNDARRQFLEVLNEILRDDKGNPIIDTETGEPLTRGKARMRLALSSRNPKEFETVLAYAVGKPKEQIELSEAVYNLREMNLTNEQLERIANGEDVATVIGAHLTASDANSGKPE